MSSHKHLFVSAPVGFFLAHTGGSKSRKMKKMLLVEFIFYLFTGVLLPINNSSFFQSYGLFITYYSLLLIFSGKLRCANFLRLKVRRIRIFAKKPIFGKRSSRASVVILQKYSCLVNYWSTGVKDLYQHWLQTHMNCPGLLFNLLLPTCVHSKCPSAFFAFFRSSISFCHHHYPISTTTHTLIEH